MDKLKHEGKASIIVAIEETAIGIIALSAYTSIKSANEDMTIISTQKPTTDTGNNNSGNTETGDGDKNEKPSGDDSQVTTTPETISSF